MKRSGKNMQITRIYELETRRSLKTDSYSPTRLNQIEVLGNQKTFPDAHLHRLHKQFECILQRTFGLHNWLLYMILLERLYLLVSSPLHIWMLQTAAVGCCTTT